MLNLSASTLQRTVPLRVLNQVHHLLQQLEQEAEADALLLTEEVLLPLGSTHLEGIDRFTLLISQPFSALLLAQAIAPVSGSSEVSFRIGLSFDPNAIATFIDQLEPLAGLNPIALETLQHYRSLLRDNDAVLQSEFTLRLVEQFVPGTAHPKGSGPEAADLMPAVCQPFQDALENQTEQALLLSRVANQIRQSLDLAVILETAVEQVRQCLQVDRLVIYQFEIEPPSPQSYQVSNGKVQQRQQSGYIAYESRASAKIVSVLNYAEEHCFSNQPQCRDKYQGGQILAINDVEAAYALSPCLVSFLRQAQVKAKLIAPILVQDKLWGLLIAHQCAETRQWQVQEQKFLQHIAEHLAIAIRQARLYAQLQQQKQTLERRVMERTQDLHDALLAAQAADLAKSEFLATMSHELRTPLTCVIGMSATLLRWSFGELNSRQRSYLQTIHDSGERLLELINDILDMSQIEAGRAMLDIREFSLSGLVSQTLEGIRERAIQSEVNLDLDSFLQSGQDAFVADPRRIRQILLNLLSNAIKFTPAGGSVNLKVRTEAGAAIFQVEDTGIGIPKDQQPLLFQKFQQLDPSRQRRYGGTGLGLALTKQLVELHGGWLGVESQVGVGSTFTVRIPSQRSALDSSAQPDGQSMQEGLLPSRRVVLFEEDEESANLICDMLTAAGHQVVWMIDGSTVTEQVELMEPSLVILSMELLHSNGTDMIRNLRQTPMLQSVKIIALTHHAAETASQQCLEAGADDFITKPLQPDQLLRKINALLYVMPAAT